RQPPLSLVPYTTLFRSVQALRRRLLRVRVRRARAHTRGSRARARVLALARPAPSHGGHHMSYDVLRNTFTGVAAKSVRCWCSMRSEEHTSELQSRFDLV